MTMDGATHPTTLEKNFRDAVKYAWGGKGTHYISTEHLMTILHMWAEIN